MKFAPLAAIAFWEPHRHIKFANKNIGKSKTLTSLAAGTFMALNKLYDCRPRTLRFFLEITRMPAGN